MMDLIGNFQKFFLGGKKSEKQITCTLYMIFNMSTIVYA